MPSIKNIEMPIALPENERQRNAFASKKQLKKKEVRKKPEPNDLSDVGLNLEDIGQIRSVTAIFNERYLSPETQRSEDPHLYPLL